MPDVSLLDSLDPAARSVLAAIVAAPFAWSSPRTLRHAAGLAHDRAIDALAELDAGGWVEPFELRGIVFVTLSPLGASRLAVRPEPIGETFSWRWVDDDAPPPLPRERGRRTPDPADLIGRIVDPKPGPFERAAAREEEERLKPVPRPERAPRSHWIEALPRPRGFVDPPTYQGPACFDADGVCLGCSNRPLAPGDYCLECDRWGCDDVVAAGSGAAA